MTTRIPSVNGPLRSLLALALAFGGLTICARVAAPFLTPITAAFVLAVLFAPLHDWISRHSGPASLAATATVVLATATALLGGLLLTTLLVREGAAGANYIRAALADGYVERILAANPRIAPAIRFVVERLDAADLAAQAAAWITNASALMLRGSVVQLVGGFFTFYLLFYFLRDREQAVSALKCNLPFTETETTLLLSTAVDTVHATIYGLVVTGLLLGLLGGVIFAVVGLPAPVLWGCVMAVFAILPIVGMTLVWVPAAIVLMLDGEITRAFILVLAFIALTAVDSIYYPHLVGNRMKLHTAIAFIAAIGGILLFGPMGFILGPLAVTMTLALRDILKARTLLALEAPLR